MPFEPEKVSEESQQAGLGSLRGCLVEGDTEQRNRERRVRHRALVISVLVQSAVLTLLVLVQLFGKTERIAAKDFVPIPPYGHPRHHAVGDTNPRPDHPVNSGSRYIFPSPTSRPVAHSNATEDPEGPPDFNSTGTGQEIGPACDWCVNIGDKNGGPRPPQPVAETPKKPRVVQMTQLDPAMLIRRIEPVYPPLARQIHKEGHVEVRARIAIDGTIQSLEIVGGDPMFYLSAREAVSQWLYRPTVLNGQKVEIDTYITVVYTMQHN
jgi:protein TonB